ncbi:ABC transporter ATP-binding protein [Coraliomargarita sp. SDUM461004]|uniref:ABC transporter ATP-binding protein n=1 Tax=Thalassobacterium sedimentorum TaxID=3041258 RepID=A0ABU1AES6_9BACT|nr:ABC transporter ATP-binding protein [Coraliomargarita sp. SDUM461004]MDQ8193272.1 ABC transporter ATP-binding protein [Coraliomargarita sp. SDUM461004]
MICFEDIHLQLGGQPVLRGFDWQPPVGELNLLVGANGAGKSTALKVGAGLWQADSGRIRMVDTGAGAAAASSQSSAVAYLPQAPAFHPRLRVLDILRFYARIEGCGKAAVAQAVEQFGLDAHVRHRSAALSGGLRQRLGLAVLSLSPAAVWMLDEPGLSLDPFWRRRLQGWLREACAEGRTILVATHLLAEWAGRADHCYLCERGRIADSLDVAHMQDELSEMESVPQQKQEALG